MDVFPVKIFYEWIDVSLDESRILISLQDGKDIEDSALRKLVTDAGYNVSSIKRTAGHS